MPTPPKLKRRWFQFSIRSLLLLTTVPAVWLAVQVNRARQQRRAVQAILDSGGWIIYEHMRPAIARAGTLTKVPDPPGPAWLHKLLGDEYFVRPWHVDLRNPDDEILEHVGNLRTPKVVQCTGGDFTEAGIEQLTRLGDLEQLSLWQTRLSGKSLEQLGRISTLRHLQIFLAADVTDADFRHLGRLKDLRSLGVYTDRASITDEAISQLDDLRKLEYLKMEGVPVSDAALRHLSGMTRIRRLFLTGTRISGPGLVHLAAMQNLQELRLEDGELSGEGLEHLAALGKLWGLTLRGNPITDEGLVHLQGPAGLMSIDLTETNVTKEGEKELGNRFPKTGIAR